MIPDGKFISIASIDYLSNYRLRLIFDDETIKTIDFEPFLSQSRNPMTRKYLDQAEFKNFTLEYGDLMWNDYEMCFPVADLYEGRI